MSRDRAATSNKIALLATGDEITHGDILNTNSQVIAQKLFSNGMHVGMHVAAPDNISEIEQAILFLLQSHRALIITGGLGPTSDDITRFALGKALNRPLLFNQTTWDAICARFKFLGYKENPPESNRQQALFPEGATIIANPEGTASGCIIEDNTNWIFMLPGPPSECLPMVNEVVLPILTKAAFQEILFYDHWLLFGVSEGKIAEELDALANPFDCTTGYRIDYPYIEFKIFSNNENDFKTLSKAIETKIAPYLLNNAKKTASTLLKESLKKLTSILDISDSATGGLLQSTLMSPETHGQLNFSTSSPAIKITGLTEFWQKENSHETSLEITFQDGKTITKKIPLFGRGKRVIHYAVEFICQQIDNFLHIPFTNDF